MPSKRLSLYADFGAVLTLYLTLSSSQSRPDDVTCLVFWLFNSTIFLHLLQCDTSINEACELLGSFELIEEVINSVFGELSMVSFV